MVGWVCARPGPLPFRYRPGRVALAQSVAARTGSDQADVRRLRTLGALRDVELDPLVLVQATEAAGLDRREVREHVGAATIRGDETETLVRVEPLHRTDSHLFSFEGQVAPTPRGHRVAALISFIRTGPDQQSAPGGIDTHQALAKYANTKTATTPR